MKNLKMILLACLINGPVLAQTIIFQAKNTADDSKEKSQIWVNFSHASGDFYKICNAYGYPGYPGKNCQLEASDLSGIYNVMISCVYGDRIQSMSKKITITKNTNSVVTNASCQLVGGLYDKEPLRPTYLSFEIQ